MSNRRRRSDDFSSFDVRPISNAFGRLDPRTQALIIIVAVVILLGAGIFYFIQLRHASEQREQQAQQSSQTQPATRQPPAQPTKPPSRRGSRRQPATSAPASNIPPPSA